MFRMCGRYTLLKLVDLTDYFPWVERPPTEMEPRYNIAPTQPILAATNQPTPDGRYHFELLRWGLIPSWAKDVSIGNRMINARAETLAEKPAFRTAARVRRCLIPADGFYEWRKDFDGSKTPMRIHLKDHEPFAFAGLWEEWRNPDTGDPLRSCTIITTSPNELMESIHDRMPAILRKEDQQHWLKPGPMPPEEMMAMLRPYPADEMEASPVGRFVNNPRNEGPQCVESISD